MAQILAANEITFSDLRQNGLTRSQDENFFLEWVEGLPELSESEKTALDRVKQNYLDQLEARSMIEETVKMVVVSPLLDLAGFYRQPYQIASEVPVQLEVLEQETQTVIQGRIDTLIVQGQLWLLVVESKRTQLSIQTAIPQALAYMLASPNEARSTFGLITNGGEFLFIKLVKQSIAQYDFSNTFSLLNRGNNLHEVLQILKRIGEVLS